MTVHTADLLDDNDGALRAGRLRVLAPMFRSYGGRPDFHGSICTLKLFEDNSLVRTSLSQAGLGRVLVIDGGGSLRCALVGDQLGRLAVANGWAGIVAYGCIRDSHALSGMDIGILALAAHPLKTIKRNVGESGIPVNFAGVTFLPGEYLYADQDGAIVCDLPLH